MVSLLYACAVGHDLLRESVQVVAGLGRLAEQGSSQHNGEHEGSPQGNAENGVSHICLHARLEAA